MGHHWPERAAAAAVVDAEAGNVLRSFTDPGDAERFLLKLIDADPQRVPSLALVFVDKDGFALETWPGDKLAQLIG